MKKYLVTFLIGVVLLFPGLIFAADAKLIVEGTDVRVGEESIIKVTYAGDNIGRVSGILEYDTSVLSYISGGSSEGDAGAVQLKKAGTGDPIVFQLKFKTLKEGTTTVKISTYEVYDLDEQLMGTPATDEDITISATKTVEPEGENPMEDPVEGSDEDPDGKDSTITEDPDEKEDSNVNTVYLLAGGVILVLLIMVIALVLRKRNKMRK